jgi:hypothetical protein
MTDINKIFRYSAMKSIANFTPEYSTLKPETSSDSPSAKSKGVRLVSASLIVSQVKDIGIANCILNTNWEFSEKAVRFKALVIIAKKIRVKIMEIS